MDSWPAGTPSGADLHLDLTTGRARGLGLRAALEDALRGSVRDGRLAPGTRLPPSRSLAADLGIARNTVAEAYAQLTAEGWLTARQGSGTVVAERGAPAPVATPGLPQRAPAARYDFTPGRPDLGLFPRTAWLAAARRALAAAPNEALGYSDPRGRIELRRALADYLARVRGVRTDPERIVVCTGYTQAVGLLCRTLHERGVRRAAIEEYGLPQQQHLVETGGLTAVTLPLDASGARTDLLGPTGVGLVTLTPAHQFPTGVALHPARRAAAVEWARQSGGLVVEDDYDGELRYDRQPVGALQALDPELVAYVGTASKSLAPGLRLGWLVLPAELVEPVTRQKYLADGHSGVFEQLTMAEFITSGGLDRHVRRCRQHYRRRRDLLLTTLAERAPQVRVTGLAAGLHAVLQLPPGGLSERELLAQAGWLGLSVNAASGCRAAAAGPAEERPPALVIGYGTPPEHAFAGAVDALCRLLTL
ncbi:GntR family transcriptional regulator [Kitasatospora sp. MMS16-BH015]|uniref:MocR-like pyridoxine biosynthesis transcription factor PdxR n=1 Tax=Kitasatospora sp. MMS16-BH015 TaxID=2018025 RepID=UPI000CA1E1F4|nr:PLP-dependent aminotransferase family protein [Kitasatospora sp. MMS16-BH015]AUG79003.1 GntR family transcriptional regulator [Kitasatospora sp. MMS16-BH015]